MDRVECIVIGAGVVGLAVARAFALAGREVLVIEANEAVGMGTSSRNSEVIHAGIYYPKGSLKARACVAGRRLLYEFCRDREIPFARCGKLIVATSIAEVGALDDIFARAQANGVEDMQRLSRAEALELEPALECERALLSPATGIVDSHALMLALHGEAEAEGAAFVFKSPVLRATSAGGGFRVDVGGKEPASVACDILINAAGLHAPAVARTIEGLDAAFIPKAFFAKGNYFALSGRAPFSRLIYPAPVSGGLGIHLTLDLAGRAKFGPDVQWIDEIDYRVDPARAGAFYAAIRRYWPALPNDSLQPGYAGVRPKIAPQGAPARDFLVQGPRDHGVSGLVNLFGIESPGLTASLALAELVCEKLSDRRGIARLKARGPGRDFSDREPSGSH